MINDAHVFFAGYVAAEPSYKVFANGSTRVKLRVAYTARRRDRETGEWGDGPTSFLNVYCWRQLANHVAMCVRKGEPVVVQGRLQIRRFEHRDGTPGTAVEVEASALGHDLNRGVTQFSRMRKPVGATAAEKAGLLVAASLQAAVTPSNGQSAPHNSEDPLPQHTGDAVSADEVMADSVVDEEAVTESIVDEEVAGSVVDEDAVAEFARELSELREAPEVTHPLPGSEPASTDDPSAAPPPEDPA